MDELNLYDDLDEFQEQQDKKSKELQDLECKYQEAIKTIEAQQAENAALKKNIKRIEVNFQSLLDTARAEIRRKNKEIEQLRKEKDDICFRRRHPAKAAKESHRSELEVNEKLQEPSNLPYRGQDKQYTTRETQLTDATSSKAFKRIRSPDREHLNESDKRLKHKRHRHNDEQQKERYDDFHRSSSSRYDSSRNHNHERKYYDSSHSSKSQDDHHRSLNRNRDQEEHKKHKSPERRKSPNHHRREGYNRRYSRDSHSSKNRSRSRERLRSKSKERNDNKYSEITTTKTIPTQSINQEHNHEKRTNDDRTTSTIYHKEINRDLGKEKLKTPKENHISTLPKDDKIPTKINKESKKKHKQIKENADSSKTTEIKPTEMITNSSINTHELDKEFKEKESPAIQNTTTTVTAQDESARDTEVEVDTNNKLGTPHKLTLYKEIFGQSPSTTSSTKSLSNNTNDLLDNPTPLIDAISSTTTSPGDYTEASSCSTTPKKNSDKKEQNQIKNVENKTVTDKIDDCFVRNDNYGSEKTIADTIDLSRSIVDDIANEIQYLQIPGLDLCETSSLSVITENQFDKKLTNLLNSRRPSTSNEATTVSNESKLGQDNNENEHENKSSTFKEYKEKEQENKSAEADTNSRDANLITKESIRLTESPEFIENETHKNNTNATNAREALNPNTQLISSQETILNQQRNDMTGTNLNIVDNLLRVNHTKINDCIDSLETSNRGNSANSIETLMYLAPKESENTLERNKNTVTNCNSNDQNDKFDNRTTETATNCHINSNKDFCEQTTEISKNVNLLKLPNSLVSALDKPTNDTNNEIQVINTSSITENQINTNENQKDSEINENLNSKEIKERETLKDLEISLQTQIQNEKLEKLENETENIEILKDLRQTEDNKNHTSLIPVISKDLIDLTDSQESLNCSQTADIGTELKEILTIDKPFTCGIFETLHSMKEIAKINSNKISAVNLVTSAAVAETPANNKTDNEIIKLNNNEEKLVQNKEQRENSTLELLNQPSYSYLEPLKTDLKLTETYEKNTTKESENKNKNQEEFSISICDDSNDSQLYQDLACTKQASIPLETLLLQSPTKKSEIQTLLTETSKHQQTNQSQTNIVSTSNQEVVLTSKDVNKSIPSQTLNVNSSKTNKCTSEALDLQNNQKVIEMTNDVISFPILEPLQIQNLTPQKHQPEHNESAKIFTTEAYNASPSLLPSISTSSPTPSNFSGIFSKQSSHSSPTEDDFHKIKKKSPHSTAKPREYILPAASVLCNMDNLENATKLNKRLHWELLENKQELTEIEDDTDIETTDDEEQQKFATDKKQKQRSPIKNLLEKQIEQINETFEKDTHQNMPVKVQKTKIRKYKIAIKVKAKLKSNRLNKLDILAQRKLIELKKLPVVSPKRQRGRPRKLANLFNAKTKLNNDQNTELLLHKENKAAHTEIVERNCALNSDQNQKNSNKCVQEIYQNDELPNVIINDSLNDKDHQQKCAEEICINIPKHCAEEQFITNKTELNVMMEVNRDNNEDKKSTDILKKGENLKDQSSLNDKYNSAIECSGNAFNANLTADHINKKGNELIAPNQHNCDNKDCEEVSTTSFDSEERLQIVSDGGQETNEKQTADTQAETATKIKLQEESIATKKTTAATKKAKKYISLEDIGIKVRPFKGHLSTIYIPKANKEQAKHNSWQLENYVEVTGKNEVKEKDNIQNIQKSDNLANYFSQKSSLSSYRIPKIKRAVDNSKDSLKALEANENETKKLEVTKTNTAKKSSNNHLNAKHNDKEKDTISVKETTEKNKKQNTEITKTGKRKLFSTEMYSQHDSIASNTNSPQILCEKTESNKATAIKQCRKSMNLPQNNLGTNSEAEEITDKHLKSLPIISQSKPVNKRRQILDSSSDENEEDNKPINSLIPHKTLSKSTTKTVTDALISQQQESNAKRDYKTNDSSELKSPATIKKPLKERRKSMFADNKEIFEKKTAENLSCDYNKKSNSNSLKLRRNSMFVEAIADLDQVKLPNRISDSVKARRKSILIEPSSSNITAVEKPNLSTDLQNDKICHSKATNLDVNVNVTQTPTKIHMKTISQETTDVYKPNTEELLVQNTETKPNNMNLQHEMNLELNKEVNPAAYQSSENISNIEGNTLNACDSKKEIIDSSMVLTQQNLIKIRRKSTNQRCKLDSSSEYNEPPVKKPSVVEAVPEIKIPLEAASNPKRKPRKKRHVKVLSTSMDGQNKSTNTSIQSDNFTQPSPLSSPLLNHPIFNADVSTPNSEFGSPLLSLTTMQQDDKKFKEIDSKLHDIFQSPQHASLVDSTNISVVTTTLNDSECKNVTVEETVNMSELTSSCSNLNNATATHNCSEIKHLALGSAEYRFEKVSENVVNLFISRKRKRKHNN